MEIKENQAVIPSSEEKEFDLKSIIVTVLVHWKWFVISLILCLALGFAYMHYATKIYNATATIMLKDEKKGGLASDELSVFADMGIFAANNSVDNEIEVIKSVDLLENVVKDLNLYVNYIKIGKLKSTALFYNPKSTEKLPIEVNMDEHIAARLSSPIILEVTITPDKSISISGTYEKQKFTLPTTNLPGTFQTPGGELYINVPDSSGVTEKTNLNVVISAPAQIAEAYSSKLSIQPTSKTTSALRLTFTDSNRERGIAFLTKLIELYNQDVKDDKNRMASNAAKFIDERLTFVDGDLNNSEKDIENFKRSNQLTDISSESQLLLKETNEYDKQLTQVKVQKELLSYLESETQKVSATKALLPSTTGLSDLDLNEAIDKYNTAVLERDRLLTYSSETSPVIIRADEKVNAFRQAILSGIQGVRLALNTQERDLERQRNRFAGSISQIPAKEREFLEKTRQQELKQSLYLTLLGKKEETALSLAVTVSNAKVIETPRASAVPISPKNRIVMLASLLLGLLFPVLGIWLKTNLSFRIENENQIKELTRAPIIIKIPMAKGNQPLVVGDKITSSVAETFRLLRTNLLFSLRGNQDKKVILVTSSTSGEGKTFVALNLAATFALKYKTIVVGLDIRKPRLAEYMNVQSKEGVTSYLAGLCELNKIIYPTSLKQLDLIPSGHVPHNPNELLMESTMDKLFEELRKQYDYIIVDSSPVGMVSDSFLLDRVSDITLYVTRVQLTTKESIKDINAIRAENKLKDIQIALNGVVESKLGRYGGYGYGGYGYGGENKK